MISKSIKVNSNHGKKIPYTTIHCNFPLFRNLCDIHQEGKLNPEQFMLAMWLISRKQAGKDPPAALTPDMVPPTMRPKGQDAVSTLDLYPFWGRPREPPSLGHFCKRI